MMEIEKPRITCEETDNGCFARFVVEPLDRGFGITLGNCLRRVLLSALPGAAPIGIKINGVQHEFSTIRGVAEDVVDIVLNIKGLAVALHSEGQKNMTLKAEGPCEVTAAMIEHGHDIEIMNPDLVICNLDAGAKINMEMTVGTGKGYVPAALNKPSDAPIGLIAVDSIYSPVRKVSYKVENTRVGQATDYDKLTMIIETNGVVSPEDAVALAARILQDQLKPFINFDEPEAEVEAEKEELPFNRNLLKLRKKNCHSIVIC